MEYLIFGGAVSAGVWVASMFGSSVSGLIPASVGGGATPSKWVGIVVQAAIISAVVVAAGKVHGKVGKSIKEVA